MRSRFEAEFRPASARTYVRCLDPSQRFGSKHRSSRARRLAGHRSESAVRDAAIETRPSLEPGGNCADAPEVRSRWGTARHGMHCDPKRRDESRRALRSYAAARGPGRTIRSVERSTYSVRLKRRLFERAQAARVRGCAGRARLAWATISLILDHINGVRDDHRIENLRIVCANCAATFARTAEASIEPRLARDGCGSTSESRSPAMRSRTADHRAAGRPTAAAAS